MIFHGLRLVNDEIVRAGQSSEFGRQERERERERERKAGKDFRRFTLRSGCAPHCWPCQLYTRPETQRRHLRGDGHAPIHTHAHTYTQQGGRGEGMGIGKLSCRPKLDYGFAVYTHSHT